MNQPDETSGSASTKEVTKYNREAWDKLVSKKNEWTVPVTPEQIAQSRSGTCVIVLTPQKPVPQEWLMPIAGRDVLCLAGGGGQQAPMLAAAGARVTTLDNSPAQLAQDRAVAAREGLDIETVEGLMQDLSCFPDASFDLIVHPCSNCFVPDVLPVWREAFRVLRPGGELLSGFTNPLMYIFDIEKYEQKQLVARYKIPFADTTSLDDAARQKLIDAGEPFCFGHSLADQIGGQLAAGFMLSGFYEDDWSGSGDPLSEFIDCFIATRATKPAV